MKYSTPGPRTQDDEVFSRDQKIAVFIDGANLYVSSKALGFDIDYRKILRWVSGRGNLMRAYYYTALFEDQDFSPLRPLVDWLDYNGFTIVTKQAREYLDSQGRRKTKGSIDVELAVDMMEIADKVDHVILFSGDGDFHALVKAVQRKGVRVTVVGTISTQPSMIADELRRQADQFLDLKTLAPHIQRAGNTQHQPVRMEDAFDDEDPEDNEDDLSLPAVYS